MPLISLVEEDSWRQVNPDQTLSTFGVTVDDSLTGIMSNYGANEVFRALPKAEELYIDDYELMAGNWPQQDTECVVVLTGSGKIPDIMLYAMGLRDRDQLDAIERSKQENREIYERMLQMNEKMFTSSLESLAKNSASAGPTTQIIK